MCIGGWFGEESLEGRSLILYPDDETWQGRLDELHDKWIDRNQEDHARVQHVIICMEFYHGLYKRHLVWLSPRRIFAARRQRHDLDLFAHIPATR